jgi:polar amino acid transport system permease protein
MLAPLIQNLPYLLRGASQTVFLAGAFVTSGIVVGVVLGTLSVIGPAWFRALIAAYVFLIRGIPVLVLMFIAYYAPAAFGLQVADIYPIGVALALYGGSYVTEIVRGSILAIPKGQIEAAKAIGMRSLQILRIVVLPQALRLSLPALLNNTVIMIKSTAYVSLVGIWELTYAAREIVERTMAPFDIFIGVMIIYFVMCYPLSLLSRHLEATYAYES